MNARESIISKQVNWALNEGGKLIGSKEGWGERNYTAEIKTPL